MKSSSPTRFAEDLPADSFLAEAEESLERSGRIEDLVKLYETRASESSDDFEASHLLCRAAELVRNRANDPAQAELFYRQALLVAPDSVEPLRGLKLIYETAGDYLSLAAVLERLADQATGAESASLLLKAADLYETRLHRRDRAVLCCQRASKADPKDRRAFRRIRQLFLSGRRYQSAFESLERERASLGKDSARRSKPEGNLEGSNSGSAHGIARGARSEERSAPFALGGQAIRRPAAGRGSQDPGGAGSLLLPLAGNAGGALVARADRHQERRLGQRRFRDREDGGSDQGLEREGGSLDPARGLEAHEVAGSGRGPWGL